MALLSKSLIAPSERNQDIQKETHTRNKILAQNRALAKKNSSLMGKISELEGKMSDLIQENLAYRHAQANAEDSKRKWLAEKLNIIEESTLQRFEEMFQMFSNIRANEGLPSSNISMSNLLDITNTPISDKTVSFDSLKTPKNATGVSDGRIIRRRKSSRRQSFYVPSDPANEEKEKGILIKGDIPSLIYPDENKQDQVMSVNDSSVSDDDHQDVADNVDSSHESSNNSPHVQESYKCEVSKSPIKRQSKTDDNDDIMKILNIPVMYQPIEPKSTPLLKPEEVEQKISNSPMKPESSVSDVDTQISLSSTLSPVKIPAQQVIKPHAPKLQVYKDQMDPPTKEISIELSDSSPIKKPFKKTLSPRVIKDQSLVSKTVSPPASPIKKQKNKKISSVDVIEKTVVSQNEAQPIETKKKKRSASNAFLDESSISTGRSSRTRGTRVSYVEPPLRSKLRRESAGFVSAVADNAFCHFNKATSSRETSLSSTPEPSVIKKSPKDTPMNSRPSSSRKETDKNDLEQDLALLPQSPIKVTRIKSNQIQVEQDQTEKMLTIRRPLSSLSKNMNKNKPTDILKPLSKSLTPDLSVFDLVEESAVGVPKTYNNTKNELSSVGRKKSTGRRNSSLL